MSERTATIEALQWWLDLHLKTLRLPTMLREDQRVARRRTPHTTGEVPSSQRAWTLNKAMVLELARCEFLTRRENVLLFGNSGTGKTHALALGLAACQQGRRVRFTATTLVHELIETRDERKLLRFPRADRQLRTVDR